MLRTNLTHENPAKLWEFYIQLTQVEAGFKDLNDDWSLRPIFHQLERRIEAHMFVAFQAYCLHVSLRQRLGAHAPGLTPRSVLEKFAAIHFWCRPFQRLTWFALTCVGMPLQLRRLG